jgi:outer membrane lipase/esterase
MSLPSLRRLAGAAALLAASLTATMVPGIASAAGSPFSDLVIFGDSLSDTGNLSIASGGAYPGNSQPYFNGRYSNGLIWTDFLATGLGDANDAKPFYLGGNNYAFAGARTGDAPFIPGVRYQIQTLWGSSHAMADANALYVVVAGGNDMRDARTDFSTASTGDNKGRQISAQAAIGELQSSLGLLANKGAKHVLVSNLPNLGNTPEAHLLEMGAPGTVAASTDATNRFNALVPGLLSYGAALGLDVTFLDMAGAVNAVRANPAAYGITDIDNPCAGFLYSPGNACATSSFSDVLHPSSRAHEIIASAAFTALGVTPVPEPETVVLMLAGLAALGALNRRRTQVA